MWEGLVIREMRRQGLFSPSPNATETTKAREFLAR
jgi:hypothetical protein